MNKKLTNASNSIFESIKNVDEYGNEYWTARQLAKVLEYSEYRHFIPVTDRAKEACKNSGQIISDHFEDILEMIPTGKTAHRQVQSIKLSRYACYLIVQNADPSKEIVALGQTYFAVQTRLQEIQQMDEYNNLVSEDEKRNLVVKCRRTSLLPTALNRLKKENWHRVMIRMRWIRDEKSVEFYIKGVNCKNTGY